MLSKSLHQRPFFKDVSEKRRETPIPVLKFQLCPNKMISKKPRTPSASQLSPVSFDPKLVCISCIFITNEFEEEIERSFLERKGASLEFLAD